MYSYEFPRPAVTVDLVALAVIDDAFSVLLIKRDAPPFKGKLALPGGFVHEEERLERSAVRVLDAKARLKDIHLQQLASFGDPGRGQVQRRVSPSRTGKLVTCSRRRYQGAAA